MRRSINVSKPSFCYAGQMQTWRFCHTSAVDLPKGTRLRFDLITYGRGIDWALPSTSLTKGTDRIYLELPGGKKIAAKEQLIGDSDIPVYEFTLTTKLKAEETLTVVMGTYSATKSTAEGAIAAQTFVQRRRPFHLYIDPTGKGNFKEPELFQIDVRGNELSSIKVLTPSHVVRNRRFDITIRFEDQFGNLTNFADENTLIEVSYSQQRNNLSWKLFVPETGFIILPNLYFNEEGVYRITLKNLTTEETIISSPIKCFHEEAEQLFWGLLHGESEKIDFNEETENCLRHFRDDLSYNFFASSFFENELDGSNESWKKVNQCVQEFNEEDRFVAFSGYQTCGNGSDLAQYHFVFQKDARCLLRSGESPSKEVKRIFKQAQAKDFLAIPTFTASSSFGYDFSLHDPRFERVAEIYNAWGCSECSTSNGNPFPIKRDKSKKALDQKEGYLRDALNAGLRFGFVAGGLDDRVSYSQFFDSDQVQYSPGLTAIMAPSYQRDAFFKALHDRRCYATTGPRILLGFYLSQEPMGSELCATQKPGLNYIRHLHGTVAMQEPIEYVEIICNGKVFHRFEPKDKLDLEFGLDDSKLLEDIAIKDSEKRRFCYYYLRARQADGHMAWSSPIWIDLDSKPADKKSK